MITGIQLIPIHSRLFVISLRSLSVKNKRHLRRRQRTTPSDSDIVASWARRRPVFFGMSLEFNIFSGRCSAHGQSTVVTRKRGERQEHHQANESNKEAWNVVGEKETRIILIDIPTKIGGECWATEGKQTQNRAREDEITEIAIIQTANAVVYWKDSKSFLLFEIRLEWKVN
jgi:hypothetical protein